LKAAVYYETGAPEVLRYEEVPDPVPRDGEVLVRVEAIGIQGGDTLNRLGGELSHSPHIVGYQCAGTVVALGEGVAGFSVGDAVVTLGLDGSHAELRSANQSFCWKLPPGLSTEHAACVPTEFGTAHDCLFEFGRLLEHETVLVHAAASGVGIPAVQLAKRAGARVIATGSSDERLARLGEYGVDDVVNYRTTDFADAVRTLTGGKGADVIVDGVGGPTLQRSLHCLAYRGRVVSFGNAGRNRIDALDISSMGGNNQTLSGYFLGAELFLSPRPHAMIDTLLKEVADGALRVVVDRQFPLEQAAAAHAYVESRQAFGRVVLVP
jgi:NADPH:quinone reductase